ncbi:MSO1 [Candida margitis]|uniref:MSO1 n=1 Tax=Candida margitis TaxID=1775924 RepID=UPI0022279148|nr:MSO1 [Candida margitis]KAI5969995.1 MSO1 [Candida margitis]
MQHSNTGGGFFSKIRENYSTRFANLSLSSPVEKDGSTEDDTLIHRAFVKYYESKGLPYPDWLGVKTFDQQHSNQQQPAYGRSQSYSTGANNGGGHAYRGHSSSSQFQPVRQDNLFNKSYAQRSFNQQRQDENDANIQLQEQGQGKAPPPFQRSSSKLQDMYNKSRQQSTPGSGYNLSRYSR